MSRKKTQHEDVELENVQEALTKTESFIEKNTKELIYIVAGIALVVLAVIGFRNYYIAPNEDEAQQKMLTAVSYFEIDSFAVALNGDGINEGFKQISESYSFTKSKSLAAIYAGVCAYHLGNYNDAVNYLKEYDGKSINITPSVDLLIGDSYVELKDLKKAAKHFEIASKENNNLIAPIALKKLGIVYENLGKNADAVKTYEMLKVKYPTSQQASDIDKYIERANVK